MGRAHGLLRRWIITLKFNFPKNRVWFLSISSFINPSRLTRNPKELLKDFSSPIVSSKETLPHIRRQIKEAAWNDAGVIRSGKGMRKGLLELQELERELKGVIPKNISDKKLKYDLMSAAFVLKAILTVSLSRKESRGAFIREDFPLQDDIKWRRNSCLVYNRQEDTFSLNRYVNCFEGGKDATS